MAKRFYISFNTKEASPLITATFVELGTEYIRDLDQKLPINLSDHPLYEQLCRYCKNNPPSTKDRSRP